MLEAPLALALNHLLRAEPWARERLAPFGGAVVEVQAPLLPRLRLLIDGAGTVGGAPGGGAPALIVRLKPEAPAAFLRGEEHALRAVEVEGDERLAQAVLELVRRLRWDAEEDLSRLFGDVIAHRLAGTARALAAWQADAGRRLAENLADYAVDENPMLVRRSELDALAAELAELRDAVERLGKRVERLG